MPELKSTKAFIKALDKLTAKNPKLYELIKARLKSLSENPSAHNLENHKLKGHLKNYYSITIARDCRVVFSINSEKGYFRLISIGPHDDVY